MLVAAGIASVIEGGLEGASGVEIINSVHNKIGNDILVNAFKMTAVYLLIYTNLLD